MRWTAVPLLLLFSALAFAGVASIHNVNPNNLPVDPEVRDVYLDLQQLEPMAQQWAPEWKYETPKAEVAARLSRAVATLEKARAQEPDNEELALLAGAAAVEVGTASFWDPCATEHIVNGLERWCVEHRVSRVTDLIGGLQV